MARYAFSIVARYAFSIVAPILLVSDNVTRTILEHSLAILNDTDYYGV